jgi:hypothetical protein
MFITDRFVFLHIPKTAGTFVHKVLRELHCPSPTLRKLHSLQRVSGIRLPFVTYTYKEVTKHTIRRRIPEACDGSRIVVLAVRNPLDHYVSHFHFGWWRNFANRWFDDLPQVEKKFGPPAKFDFATFVAATTEFAHWKEKPVEGRDSLGPDSAEWLRYFCSQPSLALEQRTNSDLLNEVKRQMADVRVLHMENLNGDLQTFLASVGIPLERLQFLNNAQRVYPGKVTRSQNDAWQKHYTPQLRQTVMDSEWMLFELFSCYSQAAEACDMVAT